MTTEAARFVLEGNSTEKELEKARRCVPAESTLVIETKVGTKNRVQWRAGRTSLLRTLLDEAFRLKAECLLDGELAVRDAGFVADAAFVW